MAIPPIYETPGTNFHDLNLDWLISQMQDMSAGWAEMREDWQEEQATIDLIPEQINQYFQQEGIPTIFTNAIAAAVAVETGNREAADATLQGNISNEATARASADSDLGQRITNETTARESADNTLQGNIDTLAGRVTTNEGAISTLNTGLTNEATARAGADTELDARLDVVEAEIVNLGGVVKLDPTTTQGAVAGNYEHADPGTELDLTAYNPNNTYRAAVYPASPYEAFSINFMVIAPTIDPIVFLDANNVVLANVHNTHGSASSSAPRYGAIVYAPRNTAKILVQSNFGTYSARKVCYRGVLSPYNRILFCQNITPTIASGKTPVFKYVRQDFTNEQQQISYPLEMFRWVEE